MKKLIVTFALLAAAVATCAASDSMLFNGFQVGGWQVGYPYSVSVNGVALPVMCDDWAHGGLPGDTWQANYTNLGTGDLSMLRFNQLPNPLTTYDEAGWLLLQTQVTPQSAWTDINVAVWYTFDSSTPLTQGAQVWLNLAQQEANNGFPGVDFYKVGIYTPVNQYDTNPNGPQELMTIVPEPGTLAMIGAGLIGLMRFRRKA